MGNQKDVELTEHEEGVNGVRYFTYEQVERKPVKLDKVDTEKDLSCSKFLSHKGLRLYQIGMSDTVRITISNFMWDDLRQERTGMHSSESIIYMSILRTINRTFNHEAVFVEVQLSHLTYVNLSHHEMVALNRFCKIWQLNLSEEKEGSEEHQVLIAMNTLLGPHVTMY